MNQENVLSALMTFKGIHAETLEQFEVRLRAVFDKYVSHRRNTGISVPEFPAGCTETSPVAAELEDLIAEIADEETFVYWIEANLDACCDDRADDISDLIDIHAPTVAALEAERDEYVSGLYTFKGEGETLAEYTQAQDVIYGELLSAGEVLEGYSNIMALVPEVPDACVNDDGENEAKEQ